MLNARQKQSNITYTIYIYTTLIKTYNVAVTQCN